MNVRPVRLAALAVLVAGVVASVTAGSATAASPLVGGGSFVRTIPFIDGSIYAFECHAAAPGAVSTTVSSCNLITSAGISHGGAPPVTSSGPIAETHEAVDDSVLTYHVCWTASANYSDGTSQTTSGCTLASSIAGAG